jgi:hypothetical protein
MTGPMKGITLLFWTVVAGIGLSLGGGIYAAAQKRKAAVVEDQPTLAVPAIPGETAPSR